MEDNFDTTPEDFLIRIETAIRNLTHSVTCTDDICPRRGCLLWKRSIKKLRTCRCSLQTVQQLLSNPNTCNRCKCTLTIPVAHAMLCRKKKKCKQYMCMLLKKYVLPIVGMKLFLTKQQILPFCTIVLEPAPRDDDSMGQRGVNSQGRNSVQNTSLSRSQNGSSVHVRTREYSPASPNDSPQNNANFSSPAPPDRPQMYNPDRSPTEIDERSLAEIFGDRTPQYVPFSSDSPQYNSLGYPKSPDYSPGSPSGSNSPQYNPFARSPEYNPSPPSDSQQNGDDQEARFSSSD